MQELEGEETREKVFKKNYNTVGKIGSQFF